MPEAETDFAVFARAHTPALIRSAYLLTGDQHHAEDLVQSALSRTHRHWRRVGDPIAYTRKAMYHLQVSRWRRGRVREHLTDVIADRTPARVPDVALRLTVRNALMDLSRQQRAVIVLRFFEDLDVAGTAAVLGCSPGTVKKYTFRALAHLREALPELAELMEGDA
ncbi:RNA polymerase sigma24 factor [Actinorhabdospora filicis]|uniref:RNA polymerase sigma24 factor n=1 Tax=Actinorhabdospora filicis TaxID=1785913 RepID=A0A9W6W2H8_9ACTN|nr:SigE family RNA polymerase sigma factor [Actinorhabdospora filicis]GLZ77032.1 RNA polymerase sigma24 factor [Actinorhabdospora filicis]